MAVGSVATGAGEQEVPVPGGEGGQPGQGVRRCPAMADGCGTFIQDIPSGKTGLADIGL